MNMLIIAFLIPAVILGAGIAISLNSYMFNAAEQSTQRIETEMQKEMELENEEFEINGRVYNSVDEYIQSVDE